MAMRFMIEGIVCGVVGIAPAFADEIPPCRAPANIVTVSRLSALPSPLRERLSRLDAGPMVDPSESFNATDVVVTLAASRRLIFAWNRARIWIVATEHGGIAYNDPIFAYRLNGTTASLIETRAAIPATVCATATSMLAEHHQ